MQAASLLLSPLIMSGADFLFSKLRQKDFLKEERRRNDRMIKIEEDNLKFNQKFALDQRKIDLKRLAKTDAKEQQQEDRELLNNLIFERQKLRESRVTESNLQKKNNPYYLTADLVVSGGVIFGLYKMYKKLSE